MNNSTDDLILALTFEATLPDMPHLNMSMEPFLSAEMVNIHFYKHHQAYVDCFNDAKNKLMLSVLANSDADTLNCRSNTLKFYGGGLINHMLFWGNLAPRNMGGGSLQNVPLVLAAINQQFGSFEKFKKRFNTAALLIQGSGWAWLGYNKTTKHLEITTTSNEDILKDLVPLLGIDVWEHAYNLQYKENRAAYLRNIWEIINWKTVDSRFSDAIK